MNRSRINKNSFLSFLPEFALKRKKRIFIFHGDHNEIDRRVFHRKEPEFSKKIDQIKFYSNDNIKFRVIIAISRYNFFKLHDIARFISRQMGQNPVQNKIELNLYPMSNLLNNYKKYLKEAKQILPKNVRFKLIDKELKNILETFQNIALQKLGDDNDLIRLLGVISEHAFIGPEIIVVDPHHRCNTNCTHCWVHTPSVKHSKEFLDIQFPIDSFKKLVDDAADLNVKTIILQGDGEPLLYNQTMEMLRYVRKRGLQAIFFTNGILLNEKIASEIVEIGVKEIYCSFPAGTPETYKKINSKQKPETYYKVVENLKKLMEIRRANGKNEPKVITTHVIHTQNYHEIVKMAQDDVYEKVDTARFYLIRLDVMNDFLKLKKHELEAIKRQIPMVSKILMEGEVEFMDNILFQLDNYNDSNGSWSKDVFLRHGCTIGWYFNLIPAKGDISFCCHLRTVGDLSKKSFKEIWTSNEYEKWRKQGKHMKDNVKEKFLNGQVLFDEHCTHCDNHQMLLEVDKKMKKYGLDKYYSNDTDFYS